MYVPQIGLRRDAETSIPLAGNPKRKNNLLGRKTGLRPELTGF